MCLVAPAAAWKMCQFMLGRVRADAAKSAVYTLITTIQLGNYLGSNALYDGEENDDDGGEGQAFQ